MRHPFTFAFLLLAALCTAQDTVVVQTLTFDSITTRRGWWNFPPAGQQFRKVLMVHTLKCDPQTTQDQYDCGEWDYLTYHFVHEHTGVLDSNAMQHPGFRVGVGHPDSVRSNSSQFAIPRPRWRRSDTLQSVTTETLCTVGTGTVGDTGTFRPTSYATRSQYLFTAAELGAAGLVPGAIRQLRFTPVGGPGGWMQKLIVRMKATPNDALTGFEDVGLSTVFNGEIMLGPLHLLLHAPFTWDGSSNLIMDITTEGIGMLGGHVLAGDPVAPGMAVHEHGLDGHVEIGDDAIGVDPAPLAGLDTAITITLRAFGAPQLPLNTTLLEAVDAAGRRVLNVHLPWSNGRIYWDAGQDGDHDRIDKAATTQEFQGQWNDWAFVKNTVTGSMKIYLNGVLWHSGTGKTRPLTGITRFNIGCSADRSLPWPGRLDEVNVFGVELDAATIAAWRGRKVTTAHPAHSALLYRFGMDENPVLHNMHVLRNDADADHPAWLLGTVRRDERDVLTLGAGSIFPGVRPTTTFVQGDHVTGADSMLVTWQDLHYFPLLTRETFTVQGNSVVPADTVFAYQAGWLFTYNEQGGVIDSIWTPGELHLNDTLHYFGTPYEVVNDHEIGRYITPYGIGLDLGDEGFSWVYDVTDHQYLLHDSVELSAGNQQELIDLKFVMIEGDAPRPVVNVQHPWGPMRSYSYASLSDNSQLAPVTVDLHPDAAQWMLRSRLTGHGHNSNNGQYPHCCEWKDNTHYLYAGGQEVDEWHIWQEVDCANNPVYPQGGTWPGSREGWCPGDMVKDRDTELTPYASNGTLTIDYGITPVPQNNLGMGAGNYVVNMDLFEFGPAAHSVDAEIYDVYRPSNDRYRSRENPICYDPVIVLRNAGAALLTSVTYNYHVSGGQMAQHTWTGNLAHMQRIAVTLPISSPQFWAGNGGETFHVSVADVNGLGPDAHTANDSYTTHYTLPVIYPGPIVLFYKTNQRPWENALTVRDINGDVVFSRTNMTAATTYRDTLDLPPGCYEMEFTDNGLDGLSYWADPDAGTGWFKFRNLSGQTVRNFESEFGYRIKAAFAIGTIVGMDEQATFAGLSLWPNPTNDQFELRVDGVLGDARVDLMDAGGRLVHQREVALQQGRAALIDISGLPSGPYTVRVIHEAGVSTSRVMKQ